MITEKRFVDHCFFLPLPIPFFVFLVFKLYEMMTMYRTKVENVCFYQYDVLKIY